MEHTIQLICQTTALSELRKFLDKNLSQIMLSEKDKHQVTLAVEEVCANLIIHSHHCNGSDHILLNLRQEDGRLIFEIKDKGKAFNLLDYKAPDLKTVISEKRKGGLGLILVKKIMDEIEFESQGGTNTCRLIKFFGS
ncbi:ATP-binding protein [Algoriphagus limi]|uniref:ATP-binding protein n=1 Tax=Algoriphagus limi TaxID=2975273 RepID=A0ABT2G5X0_9BACT|nr:ATP-binding protein [Algoriphagus limi]MCS5490659.1 ATP-binding protein [Algoriphagus limi]